MPQKQPAANVAVFVCMGSTFWPREGLVGSADGPLRRENRNIAPIATAVKSRTSRYFIPTCEPSGLRVYSLAHRGAFSALRSREPSSYDDWAGRMNRSHLERRRVNPSPVHE